MWFFSNLVGEEGPRIQGVKCLLSTSAILKGMSATALIVCNVKLNLSSSEDTFVIRFAVNYLQNNLGQNN